MLEQIQDSLWGMLLVVNGLLKRQHPRSLGVLLEITQDLPEEWEIDRWFSEPVVAVVLPVNIFLTNQKGFPVLSKAHQAVVKRFFG